MKAIYKQRLLKLAKHLEKGKLGHKRFDFTSWNVGEASKNGCGTAGCAVGECPIAFKKQWRFDVDEMPTLKIKTTNDPFNDAKKFFGLNAEQTFHLFIPNSQRCENYGGRVLGGRASPKQVASNIMEFIKCGGRKP